MRHNLRPLFDRVVVKELEPDRFRQSCLLVPPGTPEFFSRARRLAPGSVSLGGRAWSGVAPVAGVDVSTDGGATWSPGRLGADLGRWAWRGWSFEWNAASGEHVLMSRARDEAGNEQPLEPLWNVGGYANNAVQRVAVTVA